MTRYKRRKIIGIFKIMGIVLLPAAAAWTIPGISKLVSRADEITISRNAQANAAASDPQTFSISYKGENGDILSDEEILSFGYGYAEETEDFVDVLSPLDTIADDPGAKPYPSEDEWVSGGRVIRTTYGKFGGSTYFDLETCGQVNNQSTLSNEKLLAESKYLPDFTITDTDEPQVLIYHTHTTESFEPYVRDFCDANFNYRTTDPTKNMVMVGDEICKELEKAGIGVIHAVEIHDYPSYNGSYARSRATIEPILKKYPSIKVALDIHRDAISSNGSAFQPYVEINGREAAQIMIISGCDDGTLGMPNYLKNFRFASYFEQQLESDNPGLTRPILFDYRKYNQDLTTGSLLIEVGSHGNTLDQVKYSGQLIGQSLVSVLESIKK